jgi:uncharacterized protein (DUF2147 family)
MLRRASDRARTMGSSIRRSLAIAAVLAAAWAVPAQAERYEHSRESGTESEFFEECGKQLRSDVVFSAKSITRTGKHDLDTAFFGHFQVDFVNTVTNLANGKFYTVEAHSMSKDTKAVPQGGTLFVFDTIEVGQPFTVTDMSGEIRIRERGQLRFTYLFDTGGNDGPDGNPVPGGITLEDLSVKVAGPPRRLRDDRGGVVRAAGRHDRVR